MHDLCCHTYFVEVCHNLIWDACVLFTKSCMRMVRVCESVVSLAISSPLWSTLHYISWRCSIFNLSLCDSQQLRQIRSDISLKVLVPFLSPCFMFSLITMSQWLTCKYYLHATLIHTALPILQVQNLHLVTQYLLTGSADTLGLSAIELYQVVKILISTPDMDICLKQWICLKHYIHTILCCIKSVSI